MSRNTKEIYEFSQFRLEVDERRLTRDGKLIHVPDKAFDTLAALLRRSGELVTKDELLRAVWPDSIVEENNLDQKISTLRNVLGDRGKGKQKFIETVRGHGYRFVGEAARISETIDGRNITTEIRAISGQSAPQPQTHRIGNVVAVTDWQKRSDADQTRHETQLADIKLPTANTSRPSRDKFLPIAFIGLILLGLLSVSWIIFSPNSYDRTAAGPSIDSIAVLPFENLSEDPDAEFLSDAITDSLINHISQLPELRVISRSAVFRYKGKQQDTRSVARDLNVGAVLSGDLKRFGDQVVINIRLDDVATSQQLWGNQYVRPFKDILDIQADISREVAAKLSRGFTPNELEALGKKEAVNAEVYELYARGRFFWNKRNKEGAEKAIENFEKAIALDPEFALGYVGLADSYLFLWDFADGKASDMLPKARAAVDRALQIDDSLAEAHATSGFIHRLQWQWPEAEAAFKRSLSLNPNYSNARIWFSIYYRNQRKFGEALNEIRKAGELDPLSSVISANTAYVLILNGDLPAAAEKCTRSLELDADSALVNELLGIAYLKQGKTDEALRQLEKSVDLSKRDHSRYLSSLGYAYGKANRRTEALKMVAELEKRFSTSNSNGQHIAAVYAGLGDFDNALAWLERDYQNRSPLLAEINWRFAFDGMRHDPRFQDLVQRIGLQP